MTEKAEFPKLELRYKDFEDGGKKKVYEFFTSMSSYIASIEDENRRKELFNLLSDDLERYHQFKGKYAPLKDVILN